MRTFLLFFITLALLLIASALCDISKTLSLSTPTPATKLGIAPPAIDGDARRETTGGETRDTHGTALPEQHDSLREVTAGTSGMNSKDGGRGNNFGAINFSRYDK